jgi:hypothetical protein
LNVINDNRHAFSPNTHLNDRDFGRSNQETVLGHISKLFTTAKPSVAYSPQNHRFLDTPWLQLVGIPIHSPCGSAFKSIYCMQRMHYFEVMLWRC